MSTTINETNKTITVGVTEADQSKTVEVTGNHKHSNKTLLDTYTQTNADISDAVDKKHSHANKSLLDSYTQSESDLAEAVSRMQSFNDVFEYLKIRLQTGRVDFVGIGDSNQINSGYGWDEGFHRALNNIGEMYATGLISTNENNANGGGTGYTYGFNGSQPLLGAVSGAPSELDKYMITNLGVSKYAYLESGTFGNGNNSGLLLNADSLLKPDVNTLRFHLNYGTFDNGAGSFRISIRLGQTPYTQKAQSSLISTNTGSFGMQVASIDMVPDPSYNTYVFNCKLTSTSNGITAPYFSTYMRVEALERTIGWSYNTLIYKGGSSLRAMAYSLQQTTDESLIHFFEEVRRLQGNLKTVVVCINSGLNDRNETESSVGPDIYTDGDGPDAFIDNLSAIKIRIDNIWNDQGWDTNELMYLVFGSHPISTPDDSELISYRNAIKSYAKDFDNVKEVDISILTNELEMNANSWYSSGGNEHLSQSGYYEISKRILSKTINDISPLIES